MKNMFLMSKCVFLFGGEGPKFVYYLQRLII